MNHGSAASPSPNTLQIPSTWMPPEFRLDPSAVPKLPPLPSTFAEQVYRHKSVVGSDPAYSHIYESQSYKPLEFFGDAVIEFQVSRVLRERFPDAGPGVLTFLRRKLVDNRTLAVLGWYCGLPRHIRFGPGNPFSEGEGALCPPGIVAEVFEAYIGALASDRSTVSSLEPWFDQLIGQNSTTFPEISGEARMQEDQMAEKGRDRSGKKLKRSPDGIISAVPVERSLFSCHCFDRPSATSRFQFQDRERLDLSKKGAGYWHTTITYKGQEVACGRAHKRIDARQEAWASGFDAVLKLVYNSD